MTVRLTGDAFLDIDWATGDDSPSITNRFRYAGGPAVAPFKTAQAASDWAWSELDVDGWGVDFHWFDGDQKPAGISIVNGLMKGQAALNRNVLTPYSEGVPRFRGNPTATNAAEIAGIAASTGASIYVDNVYANSAGTPYQTFKSEWSAILHFRNVTFGKSNSAHIVAQSGGYVANYGSYAINDGASQHVACNCGEVQLGGFPVVISGAPSFPYGFLSTTMCGVIANQALWAMMPGAVVIGPKFVVANNGVLTSAAGVPGNSPGVAYNGGQAV